MKNLTPHDIILLKEDEAIKYDAKTRQYSAKANEITVLTMLPKSEIVLRVSTQERVGKPIEDWPVREITYGNVEGLDQLDPDKENYIVGGLIVEALKNTNFDTTGFYRPGRQVRDEANLSHILGCLDLYLA